jgi:hypothetical protein
LDLVDITWIFTDWNWVEINGDLVEEAENSETVKIRRRRRKRRFVVPISPLVKRQLA